MPRADTPVRAARKSRELTQHELAQRAGLDQGSVSRTERGRDAAFTTVDRLLAAAGHRLYAAPTRRDDAAAAASAIRAHLRAGDRDRAIRVLLQLSDDLVAEQGIVRGVLGLAEPEPTGEIAWDAALAALVAWRLREENLPLPAWTTAEGRRLARPGTLEIDPADPLPGPADVPREFLDRGVLVWRDTFASV
ncbi:helix-turn-helix transcriptional regulator [Microcella daejeonensis]|uniref:helix-turn-helix domain-containing protein n=1 Tax=Microcella daejeonensis TaxID=2994971 RepID=UPI00226F17AA|nr:helix-turn-helix transcriptional regulator [Microcella daejeonensis]WAB84730.1 helix-turn-helix transcriptional regulator [Microcella daejeonensis]